MKFIEIEDTTLGTVLINPNFIIEISTDRNHTVIELLKTSKERVRSKIYTKTDYETIKNILLNTI